MAELTPEQRASWEHDGYFLVRGFADASVCDRMIARAIELSRAASPGGGLVGKTLVMPESNLAGEAATTPESKISKIFRLHRDGVFETFAEDPRLLDLVSGILGDDLDCFLSQFIFKNPCAWGQPWHQDSLYFRFDRGPQVGIWLAVTEATRENGCLYVLPGSHTEPVHEHVPDRRPNANVGYFEIADHDMSGETPVLMQPGDLLVFHSHLMHCSKDNASDGIRAAMVYHYAAAGTKDLAERDNLVNDWKAVRRGTPG